jgi:hypothetical protein
MAAMLSCYDGATLRVPIYTLQFAPAPNPNSQEDTLMEQSTLKSTALNAQASAASKYKQAATSVDVYVSDHPWTSIAIAAGLAALVGFLTARI